MLNRVVVAVDNPPHTEPRLVVEKELHPRPEVWHLLSFLGSGFRSCLLGSCSFSGILVSGFGLRVSGFGFRVFGFGVRVSDFVILDSGFGLRVSGRWKAEVGGAPG